jgi:hypothetical protein
MTRPGGRCKGSCRSLAHEPFLPWHRQPRGTTGRWIGRSEAPRNSSKPRRLEAEIDAGRDAEVILILRAVARFVEAGQKIVHLDRTEREMMGDVRVAAAAARHRKTVVGSRGGEAVAVPKVRHTDKHLAEWREAGTATIGDARAKKIGRERSVYARAK